MEGVGGALRGGLGGFNFLGMTLKGEIGDLLDWVAIVNASWYF